MIRHTVRLTALSFVTALVAGLGLLEYPVAAANGDSMYLSPASGSYAVGTTIAVAIRVNSNADQVNAVEADITYSADKLQFISMDTSQSAYGIEVNKSGGDGAATTARGNLTPLVGDKLVGVINFKVLTTGQATIQVQNSSQALAVSDYKNVLDTFTGSNLTLVASGSTSKVSPSPVPVNSSTGGSQSNSPNVSVRSGTTSKQPTTTAAATTGNGKVELSGAAVVEATPNTDKQIDKVEYYLNKSLIATVTKAPYRYSLDTKHVRNGSYTLTVKTYYGDKTVDATNTAVVVKNPWDATQIWLQIRHYLWVLGIIVLVIADIIWVAYRKRKRNAALVVGSQADAFKVYGGDDGGSFMTPKEIAASVDQPANAATAANAVENTPSLTTQATPGVSPTTEVVPVSSADEVAIVAEPVAQPEVQAAPEPLAEPLQPTHPAPTSEEPGLLQPVAPPAPVTPAMPPAAQPVAPPAAPAAPSPTVLGSSIQPTVIAPSPKDGPTPPAQT